MGSGSPIGAKELLLKRMELFPREFIDDTYEGQHMDRKVLGYCEVPSAWGMRAIPKVTVVWFDVLQRLAYSLDPSDWGEVSDALRQLVYDSASGTFYDRLRKQSPIPAKKRVVGDNEPLTPAELRSLQLKLCRWREERDCEVTCYEDWDGDYIVNIRDENEWVEYDVSKDQIVSPYRRMLDELCTPTAAKYMEKTEKVGVSYGG